MDLFLSNSFFSCRKLQVAIIKLTECNHHFFPLVLLSSSSLFLFLLSSPFVLSLV